MANSANHSNSTDQSVIDFTANYTSSSAQSINGSTTLESIGIETQQDIAQYMMELEDSFGLTYVDDDANGIVTVGDVIAFINQKLGV